MEEILLILKIQKDQLYPFINLNFKEGEGDRKLLNLSNFLFFKLQQSVFEKKLIQFYKQLKIKLIMKDLKIKEIVNSIKKQGNH